MLNTAMLEKKVIIIISFKIHATCRGKSPRSGREGDVLNSTNERGGRLNRERPHNVYAVDSRHTLFPVCACVCVSAYIYVCVCVCMCLSARMCVCAVYASFVNAK